jgi:uncharacterized protein YndB with AHSA1/START domain
MVTFSGNVVERRMRIEARPEVVFQYFVDPAKMLEWKGVEAELDPRPGGIYRVNVTGREVARGEYMEVTPHSRVVFSWGWEGNPEVPPGSSTVEVTLTPDGTGTLLVLRHGNLPEAAGAGHAEGWDHFLPRLATRAAGGDPGVDPWTQPPPQ